MTSIDWTRIRNDFPCTKKQAFLNTGTLGPVPGPVMERYLGYQKEWNEAGPGHPKIYGGWHERTEATRTHLAAWLGVEPRSLTFAGNVTDAINIGLFGLNWKPGDRIITTDEEHGALVAPLSVLADRGVDVEILHYGLGGEELIRRIAATLQARPARLVVLSHVSCETGALVDPKRLADVVHGAGGVLMLDGAQAGGQVALDLAASTVDLYALNGHKWMLGPVGTGALYVSPGINESLQMTFVGDGSGYQSEYPNRMHATWTGDAKRFEFATRPWPALVAWNDVMDYWEAISVPALMERQRELARALASKLAAIPGVKIWSPDVPHTGITCAEVEGIPGPDVFDRLRAMDVITRPVRRPWMSAVRFSTAFFTNEEDVERAAAAMSQIAAGR
ncbi:MAG: aminotransferase class V-fold PLP-dependent enzyme [Clostridia bacterium]